MRTILFFLLVFICGNVFVQTLHAQTIVWSAQRKLDLSDFQVVKEGQKVPAALGNNMALTRTGFSYTLSKFNSGKNKGKYSIKVYAVMYPQNSYIKESVVKASAANKAYLLKHEQNHFDISEIFAREFARYLRSAKIGKNFEQELKNEMQRYFKEASAYHQLYDMETNNGRNRVKQESWNDGIAKRLNQLSPYTNKSFIISSN